MKRVLSKAEPACDCLGELEDLGHTDYTIQKSLWSIPTRGENENIQCLNLKFEKHINSNRLNVSAPERNIDIKIKGNERARMFVAYAALRFLRPIRRIKETCIGM